MHWSGLNIDFKTSFETHVQGGGLICQNKNQKINENIDKW